MIRTEDAELLESPHSAVVGTVDPAGLPDASRAWGIWVDREADRLRCLLPAGEERLLANLAADGRIAINLTHVADLRSVQVKGRALSVEPATEEDLRRHRAYWEAFLENVHRTDGTSRELLTRLTPAALVAVEVAVDSVFDQTPGPTAGAPVAA